MPGRIMIVDDEPALLTMLRYNLERHDFEVTEAATGEQALELAMRSPPDAILLDWMLPRMSGLDVCRELRRLPNTSHTPVIMLTARVAEADRVQGLSVGADDFVAKPFSIAELIARLRALLRRSARQAPKEVLSYRDLVLDIAARKVTRAGVVYHLGPTEFRLLAFLMHDPGRAFSRADILKSVWGPSLYVEERTVDVHIRLLRRTLNAQGGANLIRTVRTIGYALDGD